MGAISCLFDKKNSWNIMQTTGSENKSISIYSEIIGEWKFYGKWKFYGRFMGMLMAIFIK